jgi:RNA polymerase sigma factor (sigma-70 family)
MNDGHDKDLLLAFLGKRDDLAFAALVRRHADLVFGTALRLLGDRQAAEEISQNVFITLARKAHWLTGEGGLAGWLYRTTVLEARFRQRTDARRHQRERTAIELGTTMQSEESLLKSLVPLLDDALMQLSEKDRHAVLCRFFEGKSFRELSLVLGTGEDAAQKRVSKSLDQLARFFRRQGYAGASAGLVARTLQAAGTAAPTELVASLAATAAAARAISSLTTAALFIGKFMSLTKVQTVGLCILLGAAPVGYEWGAAVQAASQQTLLEQRLTQSQRDLETAQRQRAHWRRRLQAGEDSIEAARREMVRLQDVIAIARSGGDSGLYLWSEDSDYVRLPKSLASKIVLSSSHEMQGSFPPQREQESPVLANGSISDALTAALSVTEPEQQALSQAFADLSKNFHRADAARTYATNMIPKEFQIGNWPSQTVVTQAGTSEDVEQMRESFRAQLVTILGEERTAILWKQAEAVFRESFNDFGAIEQVQTVAFEQGRQLGLWNLIRHPGDSSPLSWGSSSGPVNMESVPDKLRPFVADWRAQHPDLPNPEPQP